MTREPILLVGAGGHSRACIDVIEQEGRFVVKGLVGLPKEVGLGILDYLVLGTDEGLPKLLADCANVLITVGANQDPGSANTFPRSVATK